jgi:microcystin-dependent protein
MPYIGEIRMFGGNFAPAGWAFCDGQLIPISENDTLFNLIGTTYGGDGESTFALPNLQSRVPLHQGNGFVLAQTGGAETVTLNVSQIPQHNHTLLASAQPGNASTPTSSTILSFEGPNPAQASVYLPYDGSGQTPLANQSIGLTGGNQPHDNMQPYLAISFIISLFGVFPTQN